MKTLIRDADSWYVDADHRCGDIYRLAWMRKYSMAYNEKLRLG